MSSVMIVCTEYGPPWNEGEKNIARVLASRLSEHGFEPFVWAKPMFDGSAPPHHRVSLHDVAENIRFWAHIARVARARGACLIHLLTSVSSALGVKSFLIRRLSGRPLLLHVTGLASPLRGYSLLLSADRIVVGGGYLKPFFPTALDLPPLSPHMNLHGPPLPARERGDAAATRRILYLGSMEYVRGVHTLVEALALMRERNGWRDFVTTIAWNGYGAPAYAMQIREQITRHRLEPHVRWVGVVPDPSTLYRDHDVVVIPPASRERMGFPLRLIEALSYGKPVIVSDIGEMPRVVDGCGLVFGHGDASGLAAALHRLLTDGVLYERCRDSAYQRALTYDASRTVGRVATLYRELVGSS